MWRSISAVLVAAAVLLWAGPAFGQACCAASELRSPSRLAMGQMWGMGVTMDTRIYSGVYSGTNYRALDDWGHEFRQSIFAARRLGESWQVAGSVPFVQSRRQNGDYREWGGGVGDISALGRYEIVAPGMSATWPGIAVSAQATIPTGRSPTASMQRGQKPLQADVTGGESARLDLGLDVAWSSTPYFAAADVGIYQALPFTDGRGDRIVPGPGGRISVSAGRSLGAPWVWDETVYASVGIGFDHRTRLRSDGASIGGSSESMTQVSLAAGAYLTETIYLSLSTSWHIPVDYFGRNRLAGPRAGLVLKRVFYDL